MGVDFYYCGECRSCYCGDDFTHCSECAEMFDHPREGKYCCECLPKDNYVTYKNNIYCKHCYKHYIMKVKCSVCKEKKKKSEFRNCSECDKKLNYKLSRVYVCDECDNDFLCKKCDDKVYFCNKTCSDKYKIRQRKWKDDKKIRDDKLALECKERYDYAKKTAIKFNESLWKECDKLCEKCKIFPCECRLITANKRMECVKKLAIKFDESKWDIYNSSLCTECAIFPCECSGNIIPNVEEHPENITNSKIELEQKDEH